MGVWRILEENGVLIITIFTSSLPAWMEEVLQQGNGKELQVMHSFGQQVGHLWRLAAFVHKIVHDDQTLACFWRKEGSMLSGNSLEIAAPFLGIG